MKTLAMFVIAGILIWLAIKKDYSRRCFCPSALARFWRTCLRGGADRGVMQTTAPSALGENGFLTVLFTRALPTSCSPS
jgi:Na+-transporting methylmalonyl-CoA/oxaloacetate decarboxylase beta subunit